ncbi:MAG: hypothetical protein V3574_05785 [Candidatus Moraniibacteriota bacterium]
MNTKTKKQTGIIIAIIFFLTAGVFSWFFIREESNKELGEREIVDNSSVLNKEVFNSPQISEDYVSIESHIFNENNTFNVPNLDSVDVEFHNETELNCEDFKLSVEGSNRAENIFVKSNDSNNWCKSSYVPYKPGNDTVLIKNKDNILIKRNIYVDDISFAQKTSPPVDVSFDKSSLFKDISKDIYFQPTKYDAKNALGSIDSPGRLSYIFSINSDKEVSKQAVLDIYNASGVNIDNYKDKHKPHFIYNLEILREITRSASAEIDPDKIFEIAKFSLKPMPRGIYNIKRVDFGGGKGVRFTLSGYYQEDYFAKHPIYIFQGLTDDEKYYVHFGVYNLYSPKLEESMNKIKMDNPDFKNINYYEMEEEKLKKWEEWTFDALLSEKEEDFVPKLSEVDKFIKSLSLVEDGL